MTSSLISGTDKTINGLTVGATYVMFLETRASITAQIESGAEIVQNARLTQTESKYVGMCYYDAYIFKATSSTVKIHSSTLCYMYARIK